MKIKTKIIGSIAGQDQTLDEAINEWIDSQSNIEIVDIKFQAVIGKTSVNKLTVIGDALIIYKEHEKNDR